MSEKASDLENDDVRSRCSSKHSLNDDGAIGFGGARDHYQTVDVDAQSRSDAYQLHTDPMGTFYSNLKRPAGVATYVKNSHGKIKDSASSRVDTDTFR